jgi:hypothetical protein
MKIKTTILILFLFLQIERLFAQLPSYLPTSGLVAWYPFNGNANDESGNGNNATNYGGVLTIDRNNNPQAAYSFASGYVSVNSGSFGSASFTFSAWAKPNSITGNGFGDIGGTYFNYQGYFVGIQNGIPKARIHSSVNNSIQEVASAQAVLPNEWYHITVTYETPILKIYVNGINTGTVNTGTFQFTNRNSFAIGRSPWVLNESQSSFPGSIDDVAIYNRALTPIEINSVYTNTTGNTGGGTTTTSPVPPGIPYQAEVRNESGGVLANANVNIRFTLHELTSTGTVSYQETHALSTNELGLFAATIGAGTAVQGTFTSINWSQTTKFLQVEVDTGNGWITMGNQKLMSVPYALYAANGPQGPIGLTGPQGLQGEQGPAGVQGEAGPQGLIGMTGATGLQGPNGFNSLIKTSTEHPGLNCSQGGIKIEVGTDTNNNNYLDSIEINQSSTKYVCNGSGIAAQNIADWKLPDGLLNISMINWTLASSTSVSSYNHTPYTVPNGKNLYVRSSTSSQAYNGCNPGIYCNGIQINNASCGGATNSQIYILPAGSTIAYNGGCSNGYGCSDAFASFSGFLVDASVTAIFQTSSIVVPTGQIFVSYSNTSLPSFYTAGQSVPANTNGYLISVQ